MLNIFFLSAAFEMFQTVHVLDGTISQSLLSWRYFSVAQVTWHLHYITGCKYSPD